MEPTVELVLLGLAALAALVAARGRPAAPERQPVPVRTDDERPGATRHSSLP